MRKVEDQPLDKCPEQTGSPVLTLRFGDRASPIHRALDPLADEISWTALRLTGADPAAIHTKAQVHAAASLFGTLLDALSVPGRSVASVQLSASAADGGPGDLVVSLLLGWCGPIGTTSTEAAALAHLADAALRRAPAPYGVEPTDAEPLLGVGCQNIAHIMQRTVTIADEYGEATVVSPFDKGPDDWLVLVDTVRSRPGTTVRATILATTVDPAVHLALRAQLRAAQAVAVRADDAALARRCQRVEATAIDRIESLVGQAWIGEITVASSQPLGDVFLRTVASAFTNDLDVASVSEFASTAAPTVAGRLTIAGGFSIERDPDGIRKAFTSGLPLAGMARSVGPADLLSPTQATLLLRWPIPAGMAVAGTPTRVARTMAAPRELGNVGALVGTDGSSTEIRFEDELRGRHIHLLGVTGTGKSTLISTLAADDLAADRQFVLVDPHGDTAAGIRARAAQFGNDVLIVDPGDAESEPIALFEGVAPHGLVDVDLAERSVARIIDAITSHLPEDYSGPVMRAAARAALMVFASTCYGQDLVQVSRLLQDERYCLSVLERYRGPSGYADTLRTLHAPGSGDRRGWIAAKFEDVASRRAAGRVFGPVGGGTTIADSLRTGRPIIVNLAQGVLSALDTRLLGHMVLAATIDAAIERPSGSRARLNLYCDEIQSFPAHNLERGLNEGRKFGLGMVLSHQHLSQLGAAARDAVLGSPGTCVAFRLSPIDAECLSTEFGVNPHELAAQPDFQAYVHARAPKHLPTFSLRLARPTATSLPPTLQPKSERDQLRQARSDVASALRTLRDRNLGNEQERHVVRDFNAATIRRFLEHEAIAYEERSSESFRVRQPASDDCPELVIVLSVEGDDRTLFRLAATTRERFTEEQVPILLRVANEWNRTRRWPTAFVDAGREAITLAFNLDVGTGIHDMGFAQFTRAAMHGVDLFWSELGQSQQLSRKQSQSVSRPASQVGS